jgi:hypothetical protein
MAGPEYQEEEEVHSVDKNNIAPRPVQSSESSGAAPERARVCASYLRRVQKKRWWNVLRLPKAKDLPLLETGSSCIIIIAWPAAAFLFRFFGHPAEDTPNQNFHRAAPLFLWLSHLHSNARRRTPRFESRRRCCFILCSAARFLFFTTDLWKLVRFCSLLKWALSKKLLFAPVAHADYAGCCVQATKAACRSGVERECFKTLEMHLF